MLRFGKLIPSYLNFTERKYHLIFIIAPLSGISVERAVWIS